MLYSGFFNSLQQDGVDDRVYNANDYSENLAAIISSGVRRSNDDDLKVSAAGGMQLSIAIGRAWIEGHWAYNDSPYTDITVPTAPTGNLKRIDRVVMRLGQNPSDTPDRAIVFSYKQGTSSTNPTAPALERTSTVYEIALADITVNSNVTTINQGNINDKRADKEVCGWVTTPVGYNDYFTSIDTKCDEVIENFNDEADTVISETQQRMNNLMDSTQIELSTFLETSQGQFDTWFQDKKDTLAVSTLFKRYVWHKVLDSESSEITFDIPQYDATGVDIIDVYVNGFLANEGTDYTLDGSKITFITDEKRNGVKTVGTEITVYCYKSIDGTGLDSVSDEVTALQEAVSALKGISEYDYVCNGENDNIKLSDLAQAFFTDTVTGENYGLSQMTIRVHGTFGVSTPYAGSGTSSSRYRIMALGYAGATDRVITFDFSACSAINFDLTAGKHYIGIFGQGVCVKNATFTVTNGGAADTSFTMFSATSGFLQADDCRFYITGGLNSIIAQHGTFNNCKGTVINALNASYCFNLHNNALLRINGGEYVAYTTGSYAAAVVYAASTVSSSVVITNAMSCPTKASSIWKQGAAISCLAGLGAFNDTVTALSISVAQQVVNNTIPISK